MTDDINCSLCLQKIWEYQRFDKTMRYGYVKYFHWECALMLVQKKLDEIEVLPE